MQTGTIVAVIATAAALCACTYARPSFGQLFDGTVEDGTRLVPTGRMDTSGINFSSLQSRDSISNESDCIALILSASDRKRAKNLHGKVVEVAGEAIAMGDVRKMFPNDFGEINGRPWSGTKCDGAYAIYVRSVRRADADGYKG
jgi:hypothetical protein